MGRPEPSSAQVSVQQTDANLGHQAVAPLQTLREYLQDRAKGTHDVRIPAGETKNGRRAALNRRPTAACGLCGQVRLLCRSHLLPRAFYRLLRGDGIENPNPNPHFLDETFHQQIPSQGADYLLCENCEQMFSRNGEDWALDHCYRGREIFRLHSYLANAESVVNTGTLFAYEAARIPEINADALAYFAASVFWRAAARNWHIQRQLIMATSLGTVYQEHFRRFLYGESDFPDFAVMVVIVSRNPEPALAAIFPIVFRQHDYFHHCFHIPGIGFHLFLGRQIPTRFRRFCLVHSPHRMIYSSNTIDEMILRNMADLLRD